MFSFRMQSQSVRPRACIPLGIGLGALLTYFLDRQRGRRRRMRLHDRLVHSATVASRFPRVAARDIAGRSAGLWAKATRRLRLRPRSDQQVAERIRAELGRVVSHPHAVRVEAQGDRVHLSGPILAREVEPLLQAVQRAAGVVHIENALDIHDEAGSVSSLQGGVPRPGARFELLQANWSPTARLFTGALGIGMVGTGLRAQGPMHLAIPIAGAALLLRASTNRDFKSLVGIGEQCRPIVVHKTIHIDAPLQTVFATWSEYQKFPRFMSRIRDVQPLPERRSRWSMAGPAGVPLEWMARVTRIEPERLIEWRADERSPVLHSGAVHFDAAGDHRTRIQVQIQYTPPGGLAGHALATLFGADPKSELDADLLRLKTMVETGLAPHDAAQRPPPFRPAMQASAHETRAAALS